MFLMHYPYIALILDVCCVEHKPPIDEVIQSGVVPRFVQFLDREDFPQLQVSNLSFSFLNFGKFMQCGVVEILLF
jgi:hypothetical protein